MKKQSNKWVKYWDDRALHPTPKIAQGRGSHPDELYNNLHKDLILHLNIDNNSSILDVGGGIGHTLKQIIIETNPKKSHLIDSSQNGVNSFNLWVKNENIPNSKASVSKLPQFPPFKDKFNVIMCGSTLGYLNSFNEVEESIIKMYNLLDKNGKILLFHHTHIDSNFPSLILLNLKIVKDMCSKLNLKSIKEVKVGPYWGNSACGKFELSILLTK